MARSQVRKRSPHFVLRLIEITSRQQQAQRTLLDWLRVEYAIEKPSNKLLAAAEFDSDTWVGEVKCIRGKQLPLTAAPSAWRFVEVGAPGNRCPYLDIISFR